MKRTTVKEIKTWMKTLEENRYRKVVNADARRIAWFVNNSLSEDYDTMPESMRKKWVKAEYKKERYMAKKFLESKKQNESVEDKRRQLEIPVIDKIKVDKILKKLRLKSCKDYDIGYGSSRSFVLDIDVKHLDKVVTIFMKNRIQVK